MPRVDQKNIAGIWEVLIITKATVITKQITSVRIDQTIRDVNFPLKIKIKINQLIYAIHIIYTFFN